MFTLPSSWMSIVVRVSSVILRIILPPGPMMSRILSGLSLIVVIRGAYLLTSARGSVMTASILSRMNRRPSRACASASFSTFSVSPATLMSMDGGHAFACAGHLEVHVAQRVFDALDIGQDRVVTL